MSDMMLNLAGSGLPVRIPDAAGSGDNEARESKPTFTGPIDGFQNAPSGAETPVQMPPLTPLPGSDPPPPIGLPPAEEVSWVDEGGCHNGSYFSVSHPPGWKLYNTPTTALVVSPENPNTLTSFMWQGGMGQMDPATLLGNVLQYNGINDYQLIASTPTQTVQTPYGSYRVLEVEAIYTYKGEPCRHRVTSLVNDNSDPMSVFWSGSVIWQQAPLDRWDENQQTLMGIAGSMKSVPAPAPPPAPPQPPPATTPYSSYTGGYSGLPPLGGGLPPLGSGGSTPPLPPPKFMSL